MCRAVVGAGLFETTCGRSSRILGQHKVVINLLYLSCIAEDHGASIRDLGTDISHTV